VNAQTAGVEFTVVGKNADVPDRPLRNAKQNQDVIGAFSIIIVAIRVEIHPIIAAFKLAPGVSKRDGFVAVLGPGTTNVVVPFDDCHCVTDPSRLDLISEESLEFLRQARSDCVHLGLRIHQSGLLSGYDPRGGDEGVQCDR